MRMSRHSYDGPRVLVMRRLHDKAHGPRYGVECVTDFNDTEHSLLRALTTARQARAAHVGAGGSKGHWWLSYKEVPCSIDIPDQDVVSWFSSLAD
jgi:hypothetical protein